MQNIAQLKTKQPKTIMKYYNEQLYLSDENGLNQQDNKYRAWIFGRDREERAQIINALEKEQWPAISIQSLDYWRRAGLYEICMKWKQDYLKLA